MNLPSKLKMNNYRAGHFAEKLAAFALLLKGYRPLAFNYSGGRGTHAGEIDLIVCRGKTVAFVEVKKRQTLAAAAYAVLPAQRERIRRNAEAFLARSPAYRGYDIRFDVVLVSFPFGFRHLQNVF